MYIVDISAIVLFYKQKGGERMAYTEAQKRASIKYINEKTDDIRLRVKAGLKEKYQKEAEKRGMSMTKFIIACVEKEINS